MTAFSIDELVHGSDFPIPMIRRAIEDRIEKLIELLDLVDDDPDEEETGDLEDDPAYYDVPGFIPGGQGL